MKIGLRDMKKFDEKYTRFLDSLDIFDPRNWEYLTNRSLPYLKLPSGADSLVISEDIGFLISI